MTQAGYSTTPLAKKLGIKPASRLRLIDAPSEFETWLEHHEYELVEEGLSDVTVLFATREEDLIAALDDAIALLSDRGGLWIGWPKKASKVPTDITEDRLRDIILPTGLVDNKVCAVSEVWSGVRFVRRLPTKH